MKLIITTALTVLLTFGIKANAQQRSFGDVYTDCGLGALIFNQNGTGNETRRILAIISNITWDLGTTAHISNLSSEETCQGNSTTTAAFIYQNHQRLETDLAQGGGDHIAALINHLNCSEKQEEVITAMRGELSASVDVDGNEQEVAYQKSSTMYNSIASACTI